MFNEPNLELVVLCVTLLIETSIRPDLTEMLRPYRVNLERGWPCMLTIDNLCNILLVIIEAILLGMAIQSRK